MAKHPCRRDGERERIWGCFLRARLVGGPLFAPGSVGPRQRADLGLDKVKSADYKANKERRIARGVAKVENYSLDTAIHI